MSRASRRWRGLSSAFVFAAVTACAPQTAPLQATKADLIAAAKREGQLTVIALPHDWCNYGGVIAGFKGKYGLTVTELNPDAGSGDEIRAIQSTRSDPSKAPDVVDIGSSFAVKAKAQGLLQPYKVSTWDTIAPSVKDAEGYWTGDYFGVLVFEANADLVKQMPMDWSQLLDPSYGAKVALAGDPRASNQAIMAVYAAGLSRDATNPAKSSQAGLAFFAELNRRGKLASAIGKRELLTDGTTPLILRWDYNALADRYDARGNPPIQITVPATGAVGSFYAQAISAYAPHPNAARLWLDYLYSDEGQLAYLGGFCHPVRYRDLAARNAIPDDLATQLPPAEAYRNVIFPSIAEQEEIKTEVTRGWDSAVGLQIK